MLIFSIYYRLQSFQRNAGYQHLAQQGGSLQGLSSQFLLVKMANDPQCPQEENKYSSSSKSFFCFCKSSKPFNHFKRQEECVTNYFPFIFYLNTQAALSIHKEYMLCKSSSVSFTTKDFCNSSLSPELASTSHLFPNDPQVQPHLVLLVHPPHFF